MTAYLILENGMVFEGEAFGAPGEAVGEVVFTTGMAGYLETLTDPSYYGQIILQTFPLIGNYGVIPSDFEGAKVYAKAYIAKYPCPTPSNFRAEGDLDSFLKEQGTVGLCGIDTRMITKIIRKNGVMNGKITTTPPTDNDRAEATAYAVVNPVAGVSNPQRFQNIAGSGTGKRIALIDFGAKNGIADALVARSCKVTVFPYDATATEIKAAKPDGVMLSNGPGDPADPANSAIVETIRTLQEQGMPIFGICLGHQLLALANGYPTKKLKFGHRGANQPVKDLRSGRVYITSQNHGYAVVAEEANDTHVTFVNVNDGTCEGMDFGTSFSVQFHPEARGGPLDTGFLFDQFMERVKHAAR
jgi:carbamoyl-phosphate synthase small subunit